MNEKSIGMDLEKELKDEGGKCITTWSDNVLTLFIQGVEKSKVDQIVEPYFGDARQRGRRLKSVLVEQDLPSGSKLPESYSGPGSLRREKLTRKLILELPAGAFVVSNIYPNGKSAFAEKLGAQNTRLAAWKRGVAAGAAQRLCEVVWTEEEFIRTAFPRPGLPL